MLSIHRKIGRMALMLSATLLLVPAIWAQEQLPRLVPDEVLPAGPFGFVQSCHSADPTDPAIHLTDRLYRLPEYLQALEQYDQLRLTDPAALDIPSDPVVYQIGDTRIFMVYNPYESGSVAVYDSVLFELRALGSTTEIWVEQEEYSPDKVSDEVVNHMLTNLEENTPPRSINPDQGIILNNVEVFAQGDSRNVPDPDGSGMLKVLVTNVQDGWTPQTGGYIAGFFNPVDLLPKTVFSRSNHAAVIYINSFPGIYTHTGRMVNPDRYLSTIAHEHQHLIQAGRGNLITFMDEGQSELAEVLNGYDARTMTFLNDPNEVSGKIGAGQQDGFFRWRFSTNNVLLDYQRAQLFHSYLHERIGAHLIGSLTMSSSGTPWVQYQRILNQAEQDLDFRQVLAQFYVANWLNDPELDLGEYGYTMPQYAGMRATNPARSIDAEGRPWIVNERIEMLYGGAKYTRWREIEDLRLVLSGPREILHYVIAESDSGEREVIPAEEGETELTGYYRSVVLVSVNTVVRSVGDYGSRHFLLSAEWTPSDFQIMEILYAQAPVAGFFPIPSRSSAADATGVFTGFSVRANVQEESRLESMVLVVNNSEEAVTGSGTLQISLLESGPPDGSGSDARFFPDFNKLLGQVEVDFSRLVPGVNEIDLSSMGLTMLPGTQYHFLLETVNTTEDAQLQLLLDQGSNNTSNTNYFPLRTLLMERTEDGSIAWRRFMGNPDDNNNNDNKNLVMAYRVLTRAPEPENRPGMPVSDRFELLANYPNPFNTGTQIRFNIPQSVQESVPVRLDLYDIAGRKVATLADGRRQAGIHSINFQAGNLSSGIYLVRFQAGDAINTRKITLIK